MRRMTAIAATLAALGFGHAWSGCAERSDEPGAVSIAVSVPPLAWVARGLAAPGSEVTVLVPPGVSPHGWEATPGQASALASADLVLLVGLGMEPSIERMVEGDARALRFGEVVGEAIGVEEHDHDEGEAHDHDEGGAHSHAVDPHLWLDPALMASLVRATHARLEALQEARGALDDAERVRLDAARDALLREIERVQGVGASRLEAHRGAGLVAVHDAWRRFAGAFGLRVAGVLQRAGEMEASAGAVAEAAAIVRAGDAQVIVVEAQYDDALARRVARETGAALVHLDPLGAGEWPAMMTTNIEALAQALDSAEAPE